MPHNRVSERSAGLIASIGGEGEGDGGAQATPCLRWRAEGVAPSERAAPTETPVAITYDASTYAVMMATPLDLEDFAIGFSLSEGVIEAWSEAGEVEVVASELGLEARMWLAPERRARLASRRRHMAGPTGCGLCGIDSLAQAVRAPPVVGGDLTLTPEDLLAAMAAMAGAQALNGRTHGVHAAAFWRKEDGLVALREDVGRHNALDKLAGALARGGEGGATGAVLLTSRVSVEMVQKTAVIGVPILVAVSAPTTLAVRTAEAAGLTLCAVARADGFEVFTHPERLGL
jgi:FdhD protein